MHSWCKRWPLFFECFYIGHAADYLYWWTWASLRSLICLKCMDEYLAQHECMLWALSKQVSAAHNSEPAPLCGETPSTCRQFATTACCAWHLTIGRKRPLILGVSISSTDWPTVTLYLLYACDAATRHEQFCSSWFLKYRNLHSAVHAGYAHPTRYTIALATFLKRTKSSPWLVNCVADLLLQAQLRRASWAVGHACKLGISQEPKEFKASTRASTLSEIGTLRACNTCICTAKWEQAGRALQCTVAASCYSIAE